MIDEVEKHFEAFPAPVGEEAAAVERVGDPFACFPPDCRIEVDHPVDRHGAHAQLPGDFAKVDVETPGSAFHRHLRVVFPCRISASRGERISRLSSSTRLKRLPSFGVLR